MNNTTFAFNGFLKSITEDINMISDPYNRARIKALVMQTLVATGSVEDQFIGVEGPVDTAASAKKPRRKKTDRQELENHPNEKPVAEADTPKSPLTTLCRMSPCSQLQLQLSQRRLNRSPSVQNQLQHLLLLRKAGL